MPIKNRICFLGNFDRTDFYQVVARALDHSLTEVIWIVVNAQQRDALLQEYPPERVLYLPLSQPRVGPLYPIKVNDLLYADRRLKYIPEVGANYLRNIQAPIFDFLTSKLPTLVVGEVTYGYELVTNRLVHHHLPHCQWTSPFLARIHPKHFSFYEDEAFSREQFEVREQPPSPVRPTENKADYRAMIDRHIAKSTSGGYLLEKVKRLFSMAGYDAQDPTWKSNTRLDKFRKNVPHYLNRFGYRFVPKVGIEAVRATRGRAVVFPLHLQPESNIDTCGRYYENQIETAFLIWRQLGPEDKLFVKEHRIAIGNRGYSWFKKLLHFPGIKVLHEEVSIPELIQEIDYVFTVSGTMGMEAALKGKKVFCLAPTSYDRLDTVVTPTIADFRLAKNIDDLYDTLHQRKTPRWSNEEFINNTKVWAFPGEPMGNAVMNPEAFGHENISLVASAFIQALEQLEGCRSDS